MESSTSSVCTVSRISVCALGFSVGMISAIWVVILGLAALYLNVGHEWVKLAGTVYIGYTTTFVGVVIGALWGFLDGFICGALIAFFYNVCAKCCHCKCNCHKVEKTVA